MDVAEQNRLANQFRREPQARSIGSPYRIDCYIGFRLKGLSPEAALALVRGKGQPKRRWHKVGVSKYYYPREAWPRDFTSYVRVYRVLAADRVEAARKVWAEHGRELLAEMLPDRKRVSLEVDDPRTKTTIGRLTPIVVYESN